MVLFEIQASCLQASKGNIVLIPRPKIIRGTGIFTDFE